jgi:hypothetical protein
MENIIENIKASFNDQVKITEKRTGIYQLYLPIYHEDGDMIDLFLVPKGKDNYVLCDYGLTLQRLSYTYDVDTENKETILQKIIIENGLNDEGGNISLATKPNSIFNDIMQITQAYAKIGSMRYFKREVVESLFYEILDEYIETELQEYRPQKKVLPIPERDDLEVDYQFNPNGHPIYLFGVKDATKARLSTISCLEFQAHKLDFKGWVVHEDFEKLPRKDKSRLTNACDKQFTSLNDFKSSVKLFLDREKLKS